MGTVASGPDALFVVYEFVAAEYGWSPRTTDDLTDEQIVGILDAAQDRVQNRFAAMVESVRIGTVIAHDRRAAGQWKRSQPAARRVAPLGEAALEREIMAAAELFPGHVIRETVAA